MADAAESSGDGPGAGGPSKPSYEAARDELLEVVRQLEAGGLPLETSLALWERGEELAVICQSWLDGARERLAARRPQTANTADGGG
jgi:exodeoxyribonuclease VII small subunit